MSNFDQTAKTDRIKSESRDICPLCQQTLWLSFYFDAFGHHKDEDGESVSNIGKLFKASLFAPPKGIRPFYYPGLGTTFNPEIAVLAAMEGEKIYEEAKDKETGIAQEAASNTKKKVAKEVLDRKPGWWQRVEKTIRTDAKKVYETYKDQYDLVFNETERNKYWRGIGRYWKNFADDLVHHPMRLHKYVKNELAKTIGKHSIERFGFVRDAAWVAALFNTGVDTRLEIAAHDFEKAVADGKQFGTVKHINVAVFGADMGGALAIAFANKLLKDVCEEGQYEGIAVHLRFMGLFDVVAARYDDTFLTGFLPLANSVTSDLKIPKTAERVVHFAAAHENRLYKPLSSIGGADQPGARLEEKLFPGAQQDVTGGYACWV